MNDVVESVAYNSLVGHHIPHIHRMVELDIINVVDLGVDVSLYEHVGTEPSHLDSLPHDESPKYLAVEIHVLPVHKYGFLESS